MKSIQYLRTCRARTFVALGAFLLFLACLSNASAQGTGTYPGSWVVESLPISGLVAEDFDFADSING
ncbi:MAG: hypothetical protein ACREBW_09720, partial [Candidatus Micrarchaeaceae archaeon]